MRPLLLALALACTPETYTSVEQCEEMKGGADRDTCYAETLPELYRTNREKAERLTREEVSDPRVRDYVYLTVTRDVDAGSMRYCDMIEETALKERCRVLVSRPHLHRELSGKPAQPFAPGDKGRPGPPPGGDAENQPR